MTSDLSDFDKELLAQMRDDFLIESKEILDRLGTLLAQLESNPSAENLNTIFREVHTLKGTAGFVNFSAIQRLSHKLEDVFGAIRDRKLTINPSIIDAAYGAWQALDLMREDITRGGDGNLEIAPYLAQLSAILGGQSILPSLTAPSQVTSSPVELVSPLAFHPAADDPKPGTSSAAESTLRVEIATVDTLMTLVGELITARNALLANAERLGDAAVQSDAVAISRLTRQLQNAVSSVRLVPIERLLNRFTPVIRNLARERGKLVRFVFEGGDTPLDRAVSEQMYDPLIHMLRNAIDHGIETPEVRLRVGKPEEGTLEINAARLGDDIVLTVSDDGQGIDPARIRAVAVQRGLHSQAEAAALTEAEAIRLIFAPGFSTATAITDISGRGVGMDVVLEHVRHLRGTIDIETNYGQGATFLIKLPLTLAILQVLLVRVGQHIYAVPLHTVRETLRLTPETIHALPRGAVAYVQSIPLPVRRLSDWLLPAGIYNPMLDQQPALVVNLARGQEIVIVDELIGKQQMVIKPLSPYLGTVPGVEGTAILPDGGVGVILDLERLLT